MATTTTRPATPASAQVRSLTPFKPTVRLISATPNAANRNQSNANAEVGVYCLIRPCPKINNNKANGSVLQKIMRQSKKLATAPPKVGPKAGPMRMIKLATPIYVPNLLVGTVSKIIFTISGPHKPTQPACTNRPISNTQNTGANAHIKSPIIKSNAAVINNWRLVKRRFIYAELSMTKAAANK